MPIFVTIARCNTVYARIALDQGWTEIYITLDIEGKPNYTRQKTTTTAQFMG